LAGGSLPLPSRHYVDHVLAIDMTRLEHGGVAVLRVDRRLAKRDGGVKSPGRPNMPEP